MPDKKWRPPLRALLFEYLKKHDCFPKDLYIAFSDYSTRGIREETATLLREGKLKTTKCPCGHAMSYSAKP